MTNKDSQLDSNGQPVNKHFANARLADRQIDELIGICKGMLSDGATNTAEASYLLNWLESNKNASNVWPANVLYPRIKTMLQDNILDNNEEKELLKLLLSVTGGPKTEEYAPSMSTTLPFDKPPPVIQFIDQHFCVTGKLFSCSRAQAFTAITNKGGKTAKTVTLKTNYLIIGEIGSRDWIHSTHGRKIEKAVQLKDAGHAIHIIPETHWYNAIK